MLQWYRVKGGQILSLQFVFIFCFFLVLIFLMVLIKSVLFQREVVAKENVCNIFLNVSY